MTEQQEGEERREFASFLVEHLRGKPHAEATAEMAAVAADVNRTGKRGEVSVRIVFSREGPGELTAAVHVNGKRPRPDPRGAIWFVDDDGNLRRDRNPAQFALLDTEDD